jgi:hypothetical protein
MSKFCGSKYQARRYVADQETKGDKCTRIMALREFKTLSSTSTVYVRISFSFLALLELKMKRGLVKDPTELGSYYIAIVALIFLSLSWPFLFLRLYVRGLIVRSLGRDDLTAVLGQVSQP